MPNEVHFRHIEGIIPTLVHFSDFLVRKEKGKEGSQERENERREEYRTHSLIKNP